MDIHVLGAHLAPGREAVDILVERSSGHFIYASSTLNPLDVGQMTAWLSTPAVQDRPDALYTCIFQEVEDIQVESIRHVLGILYFITGRVGLFNMISDTVSFINDTWWP